MPLRYYDSEQLRSRALVELAKKAAVQGFIIWVAVAAAFAKLLVQHRRPAAMSYDDIAITILVLFCCWAMIVFVFFALQGGLKMRVKDGARP